MELNHQASTFGASSPDPLDGRSRALGMNRTSATNVRSVGAGSTSEGVRSVPYGSRTRIARVRGEYPEPLDERDSAVSLRGIEPQTLRLEGASAEPPRGSWRPERESNSRYTVLQTGIRKPSDRVVGAGDEGRTRTILLGKQAPLPSGLLQQSAYRDSNSNCTGWKPGRRPSSCTRTPLAGLSWPRESNPSHSSIPRRRPHHED